jgi:hypothetical protein
MIKKVWFTPFNIGIFILTIINIVLIGVNLSIWIKSIQLRLSYLTDFNNQYTAFLMVKAGDGGKLYDLDVQSQYQQQILGGLSFKDGVLPFLNPPFIALVLSPLSFLPRETAYVVWTFGELGLLIWLIYLLTRLFSDWNKQERQLLILTILAFWPLTATFWQGQFSLFLLICLVQMYLAMKNSKDVNTGIWLALMIVKPQTVLILAMMMLNKRYWRGAISAIITFTTLIIFSSLFLGFELWIKYAQLLFTMNTYFGKFGLYPEIEYTLKGLLTRILGYSRGSIINTISNIVLLLGMVFIFFLWLRDIPPDRPRFKLHFAFIITVSAFFSLHLNDYDSLILVLPAAIFYDYLRQMGFPRQGYSMLVLSSPLVFFLAVFGKFNLFNARFPPIVVILLFIGWMVKYLILDYQSDHTNRFTNITSKIPL